MPAARTELGNISEIKTQITAPCEKAKNAIARLKGATVQIKTLQDEALSAVGNEAEQVVSEKLVKVLVQSNKDAAIAKRVLDNLKK